MTVSYIAALNVFASKFITYIISQKNDNVNSNFVMPEDPRKRMHQLPSVLSYSAFEFIPEIFIAFAQITTAVGKFFL